MSTGVGYVSQSVYSEVNQTEAMGTVAFRGGHATSRLVLLKATPHISAVYSFKPAIPSNKQLAEIKAIKKKLNANMILQCFPHEFLRPG